MEDLVALWEAYEQRRLKTERAMTKGRIKQMQDEWTNVGRGGQLVKFTYSDELPEGKAFLTAQIAGHEVVCSIILPQPEHPFSREGAESHFEHGTDFGLRPRAK